MFGHKKQQTLRGLISLERKGYGDYFKVLDCRKLEKYKELLNRRPAECPVCYESFAQREAASPLLSDIPSRCTHVLCKECWQKTATLDAECPICREGLRPWLVRESNDRLTNEQVQKFLVSVMCIQGGSKPILDASTMFDISHKLYSHQFS